MKKLLLIAILTTFSFANIGTIVALKGKANVIRNGKIIYNVPIGFKLKVKDKIKTSKKTKMQIMFNDKTVVTLGQKALFIVDDYYYQKNNKQSKLSFAFMRGMFKSVTGKIGKLNKKRFKLRTRTASIGIRGTTLAGTVDPITGKTVVACTSGEIGVTSLATGETVDVPAGQMTDVVANQAPSTPREYSPREITIIEDDGSTEEGQNSQPVTHGTNDDTEYPTEDQNAFSNVDANDNPPNPTVPDPILPPMVTDDGFYDERTPFFKDGLQTDGPIKYNVRKRFKDGSNTYLEIKTWEQNGIPIEAPNTTDWTTIEGTQTSQNDVDTLLHGTYGTTVHYTGNIYGVAQSGNSLAQIENGAINFAFEFGSSTVGITGGLNFTTGLSPGTNFSYALDDTQDINSFYDQNNGFKIQHNGSNSEGTINGKFFGNGAKGVGGHFDITDKNQDLKIKGGFGAQQ